MTANNTRARMYYVLDVILRVPPLFVMDAILHKGYPYEYAQRLHNTQFSANFNGPNAIEALDEETNEPITKKYMFITSISFDLQTLLMFAFNFSGFILAFVFFMLSRDHLILVYKWLIAIGTIFLSYWSNLQYFKNAETILAFSFEQVTTLLAHFLLQLILAVTFSLAHRQNRSEGFLIAITFILPSFLNASSIVPDEYLQHLPSTASLISLMYVKVCILLKLPRLLNEIMNSIRLTRIFIRYYGLHALLENEWLRLNVPHVLRVFWLTRVTEDLTVVLVDKLHPQLDFPILINISFTGVMHVVKNVLVRGCDTVLAVLGMTSVVATVAHYFGYAVQQFLLTDDDEERSIGTVSAVLFFVLALQTGLTGLEPEKRFIRLYRNFCLLFTAILHFVHNIVNPLLMSLSASRNRSIRRHSRVLMVCVMLIAFPCWFLLYLWHYHSVSTWMLAVSAFTIEVIIKVVISLLLYSLFMLDAYRNTFWEKLDDYIYYIRATGNTIEFIFGIFLFFNGAWILLFESGGAIRACMMCIHAYINIWLQAKAGWRTFMKRRTAVNKINALPEATEEQLQRFDDVCAICYQELTNARITKCNHYFHGVCLRKWLYVQDRCPLCHNTLYKLDSDGEEMTERLDQEGNEESQDGEAELQDDVEEDDNDNEDNDQFPQQSDSASGMPAFATQIPGASEALVMPHRVMFHEHQD